MSWKTRLLAVAIGAMSGALMAQQATSSQSTTTTTTTSSVSGSVVQYSPGQTIVLRGADGKLTTYTLGPSVQVPSDVQIGRSVTLSTEPGANGGQSTVTRVEVRSANPANSSSPNDMSMSPSSSSTSSSTQYSSSTQSGSAGQSAGSGQSSAIPPSSGLSSGTSNQSSTSNQSDASSSASSFTGKVTAYQPKQSITIEQPGKGTVTYTIDDQSNLPQDIAVGKTVTITTTTVQGSSKPVVRTVTTTTRTTKTTETHPQ